VRRQSGLQASYRELRFSGHFASQSLGALNFCWYIRQMCSNFRVVIVRLAFLLSRSWLLDVGQPGRLDLGATVAWKFWSPEGTKLIGSGQGKILERSVIKDTWRVA
jgi:hypothetical protein